MAKNLSDYELREIVETLTQAESDSALYRKLSQHLSNTVPRRYNINYIKEIVATTRNPSILKLIINKCANSKVQCAIAQRYSSNPDDLMLKKLMPKLASAAIHMNVLLEILKTTRHLEKTNPSSYDQIILTAIAKRLCHHEFQDQHRHTRILREEGLLEFLNLQYDLYILDGKLMLGETKINNAHLAGCLSGYYAALYGPKIPTRAANASTSFDLVSNEICV